MGRTLTMSTSDYIMDEKLVSFAEFQAYCESNLSEITVEVTVGPLTLRGPCSCMLFENKGKLSQIDLVKPQTWKAEMASWKPLEKTLSENYFDAKDADTFSVVLRTSSGVFYFTSAAEPPHYIIVFPKGYNIRNRAPKMPSRTSRLRQLGEKISSKSHNALHP
jgi:hypothetical protein